MPSFATGDRIKHGSYGLGTIVEANDRHTVIEFDENGRRTFVTRMVVLESSREPAPPRAARKGARKKAVPKAAAPATAEPSATRAAARK